MEDDPSRRRRLLSLPGGSGAPPQPRFPSVVELAARHRLSPSLLRPPFHPAAARLPAPPGSGFSYYQAPRPLAPAPTAAGGGGGYHHQRSLSHAPFSSLDFLSPQSRADLAASAAIPLSPPLSSTDQGPSGVPPLQAAHGRSQSDILLGFAQQSPHMPPHAQVKPRGGAAMDDLLGQYINSKGMGALGSSGDAILGSQTRDPRAWSPADSSENEADSAGGSTSRHCRSLSVDSIMGNLNFGAIGQEVSNNTPPPSTGGSGAGGRSSRSASGSIGSASALFAAEFASGEFSESDRKKIMANEHLAELVLTDPKKVKRILNNRISAAKSKERKVRYMAELERKVQVLQRETTTLSARVTMVQRDYAGLLTQNNEFKIMLQAMEQQAQLRDALNETLTAEVQRLRAAASGISDPHRPNGSHQQVSSQMIQLEQLQIQKGPSQQRWNF